MFVSRWACGVSRKSAVFVNVLVSVVSHDVMREVGGGNCEFGQRRVARDRTSNEDGGAD